MQILKVSVFVQLGSHFSVATIALKQNETPEKTQAGTVFLALAHGVV